MEGEFRGAVEEKTSRTRRRRALPLLPPSKQISEPLDGRLITVERFSGVNHSFIRVDPEDGEEEVPLIAESAIDAAFSQAGDPH